jgi:hypothetical protein
MEKFPGKQLLINIGWGAGAYGVRAVEKKMEAVQPLEQTTDSLLLIGAGLMALGFIGSVKHRENKFYPENWMIIGPLWKLARPGALLLLPLIASRFAESGGNMQGAVVGIGVLGLLGLAQAVVDLAVPAPKEKFQQEQPGGNSTKFVLREGKGRTEDNYKLFWYDRLNNALASETLDANLKRRERRLIAELDHIQELALNGKSYGVNQGAVETMDRIIKKGIFEQDEDGNLKINEKYKFPDEERGFGQLEKDLKDAKLGR